MQLREENELGKLNWRYRPALIAFFLRRVRNHADAEDLTQEVFAKLASSNTARGEGQVLNPHAYVFETAANLLRDRGRREKVRGDYRAALSLSEETYTDYLDPSRVLQGQQSLRKVVEAFRELPERTRSIFILFRLENMKHREIAAMFGISISAVEKQVLKAMVHLNKRMGDES